MEQINEAVEQRAPSGGKRLKKSSKKPLAIAGGIVAALAAAYLGLCVYAGSQDTFYPNYRINGVEVGGLTVSEAQEKLETELPKQVVTIHENTDQAVTEQAEWGFTLTVTLEELGFSSIHYFSRRFKKITGMSPSEYASSLDALVRK